MKSRIRQRGAGFIGLVFILIGLSVMGLLGAKLGPMFIDNITINEVIQQIATDKNTRNMTVKQLRAALEKRLLVNGLDQYAKKANFEKDEGIVYLTLNYERRASFWANVDLVAKFENEAELATRE